MPRLGRREFIRRNYERSARRAERQADDIKEHDRQVRRLRREIKALRRAQVSVIDQLTDESKPNLSEDVET
jgi:hypothetical protein